MGFFLQCEQRSSNLYFGFDSCIFSKEILEEFINNEESKYFNLQEEDEEDDENEEDVEEKESKFQVLLIYS